jgi:putative NADH-flavin reductase
MKILSLGANGAVGQLALDGLLNANHEVTALVRNASSMNRKQPQLTVVQGEPTNAADLEKVLAQQDVVMCTLGARTNKRTTLCTDVARNLAAGMKRNRVRKLVWLDAAGVGSSKEFVRRSSFFFGRIIIHFDCCCSSRGSTCTNRLPVWSLKRLMRHWLLLF